MGQIVSTPYYYNAESRQVRKDIGDGAHPVAQILDWAEDTDPTGEFVAAACNAHALLVKALDDIVKNDPFRSTSAGTIARMALATIGVSRETVSTRMAIRANGTEELLLGPMTIAAITRLIGTNCADSVRLADGRHVMIVDDLGHERGLPVNQKATNLYLARCVHGATHQICGDVVIVPDTDFAGG